MSIPLTLTSNPELHAGCSKLKTTIGISDEQIQQHDNINNSINNQNIEQDLGPQDYAGTGLDFKLDGMGLENIFTAKNPDAIKTDDVLRLSLVQRPRPGFGRKQLFRLQGGLSL